MKSSLWFVGRRSMVHSCFQQFVSMGFSFESIKLCCWKLIFRHIWRILMNSKNLMRLSRFLGKSLSWMTYGLERKKSPNLRIQLTTKKKLSQKKGFSSSFIFGKKGKSRLLERIYETNIDAFFRAFPEVVPPTWFIENCDVESVVDHLLSFNELEKPISPPKRVEQVVVQEDFRFALSLPYIPPNYLYV